MQMRRTDPASTDIPGRLLHHSQGSYIQYFLDFFPVEDFKGDNLALFHSQSRGQYINPQQRQKHSVILTKQAKTFLRKKYYGEQLADSAHVIVSGPYHKAQ